MNRNKLIITLIMLCSICSGQESDTSSDFSLIYSSAILSAVLIDRGDDAGTNGGAIYQDLNIQYLMKPKWGISSGINYLYSSNPKTTSISHGYSEGFGDVIRNRNITITDIKVIRFAVPLFFFYKFETRRGLKITPQVGLQLQYTDFSLPCILEDIYLSPDTTSYIGKTTEITYEPIWNAQFCTRLDVSQRVYEKLSLGVTGIFTLSSGQLGERPLRWTPETQKLEQEINQLEAEHLAPYFRDQFQQTLKITQSSLCFNIRYDL